MKTKSLLRRVLARFGITGPAKLKHEHGTAAINEATIAACEAELNSLRQLHVVGPVQEALNGRAEG